ncbi:MAG TPA: hypothetical protein VGM82_19665 [Gemmatimonadaceae bacterium]
MQTPTPAPPTATPRAVAQVAGMEPMQFDALQSQAATLNRQLAGLRVQRAFLERQARNETNDAARAQLDANRANLDVQMAQSQADLENLRAQIASRANVSMSRVTQSGQLMAQQPWRPPRVDPDVVMGLSFSLLMVIALPMSIAYARRVWRGKPQTATIKTDEISPRLERLEQAVDAIAIEVERISEGQRFVTKVMSERPRATATASTPRPDSADGGIPDARQILALGAGAAEPIRMADRQSVRQMNTPH